MKNKCVLSAFISLIFALTFALPTSSYAWIDEEDQTEATEAEIEAALIAGELEADPDGFGEATSSSGETSLQNSTDYTFTTIGGDTRYDTSAKEALSAFSTADTVIVASGEFYADSIAASSLAGALGAPILLTAPDKLLSVTSDTIKTLGAKKVIVLGGTTAISTTVEAALKDIVGSGNVTRLGGADRYETQMLIYNYGANASNKLWTSDTALIASGLDFADALSVSPVAFSLKAPVFFTDSSLELPSAQLNAIKSSGVTKVLLVGGTARISSKLESELSSIGTIVRLAGSDRYSTSKAVNDYAVANYGFTWEYVAFSSGTTAWDSLGGGAMQGKNKRLLSLLDNSNVKAEPNVKVDTASHYIYLGGKNVYPNSFKAQVAYKLGYKLGSIEGFRVYIDAGHITGTSGGYDGGASGCGYTEANLTSELAKKVANVLNTKYGLNTYENTTCKLGYKLRQAQASNLDCGVFVSIHFNASGGSGTESYIHSYNSPWGSSRLQDSTHTSLVSALGLTDRGKLKEAFAVTGGKVPAVLLEICFIDRSGDMATYTAKKDAVAEAIASGIVNS